MEIYGQVAVLGVIQGLTEFFPVSSSGHLILAQHFMGLAEAGVLVDVVLHAGTLLAVLIFLRQEIAMILSGLFRRGAAGKDGRRLIWLALLASLPTALIGLLFRPVFVDMFQSIAVVGLGLVLTSLILLLTKVWPLKNKFDLRTLPWWLALLVGTVQGLAITPGISRSGATISAAMLLGVERELAFKFSFLLSIPAISGALVLECLRTAEGELAAAALPVPMAALLLGSLIAGGCGFIALSLLGRLVNSGRLYAFFPYCLCLGLLALALG